jgi:hypothetical protein
VVKINGEMVKADLKAELACSHSHAAYTDLEMIAEKEFYHVKQADFLLVFDSYLLFKF